MSFARKGAVRKQGGRNYGAVETEEGPPVRATEETQPPNTDKVYSLKRQVSDVKKIMTDNIEKVVERENKVGDLLDRTDNLVVNTGRFKGSAIELRKSTQRRNWKLTCCIVCLVLVVLTVITVIILYSLKVIKF